MSNDTAISYLLSWVGYMYVEIDFTYLHIFLLGLMTQLFHIYIAK